MFARARSHSTRLQPNSSQKGGDGGQTRVLGAHLHRWLLALIAAGGAQPRGLLQQELACHLESLQKKHSEVGMRKAALFLLPAPGMFIES